eukprot:SAG31_NODE_31987_length_361_cov_1.087786_2_plen_30_part_01
MRHRCRASFLGKSFAATGTKLGTILLDKCT